MIDPGSRGMGVLGRSLPDYRDRPLLATAAPTLLPTTVDLRRDIGTPLRIFDQGDLGSCTAHAANTVAQYVERHDRDPDWDRLSMLWTYWYSREKIGTVGEDSGALIRDAFAVLAERGAPREAFWPYDIERFREEPDVTDGMRRALQHQSIEYLAIADGDEAAMAACVADGYPFAFGFAVYRSFWWVGSDGRWSGERGLIDGYHAVCVFGYDFNPGGLGFPDGGWIVRNQWGETFGDGGYFYVPRRYMAAEAFDCWTIRRMSR